VKWLIVLLVVLAAGLAAAAFSVPTNAAVVNGTAISQQALNSDVTAIANSPFYQCYLNSETYLSSGGSQQLPPVAGASQGQNAGDHPTANSAFVASYLDTEIGHQVVLQVADARQVAVTPAQLTNARLTLTGQISSVMSEILQTAVGQNPRYGCSVTGQPVTGQEVLATMPSSFVDEEVQFDATVGALEEDLAGVGSSPSALAGYFARHRAQFDTGCFDAAEFSSESAANEAAAAVAFGTPFSQVVSGATNSGTIPCNTLTSVAAELGAPVSELDGLTVGGVSAPISVNGNYLVVQLTKRTPTPYAEAAPAVAQAVQQAGSSATQTALTVAERRSTVSVDPRYGVWAPVQAAVLTPFTPATSDVLNPSANETRVASSSAGPTTG
jgi:PPIC-type PPIASE domain